MSVPLSGSREVRPSALRRLAARAAARDLAAFVVPGPDVARARGIDLEAAGLRVAQSPRHASTLVLVGELPRGLKKAAAVSYAQMPRPRAILALGTADVSPLPEPDVSVTASQGELATGVEELRRLIAEGAFATEAAGFDVDEIRVQTEHSCRMRHEGHDGMDHGEHGDVGIMSMVEMTQGTPRSSDGLQMEWTGAPFGPLFPGLPGGLYLTFTLDGDTVAEVDALQGKLGRERDGLDGAPARDFPELLALLDPLSPASYRVLALRALEDAAGAEVDESTGLRRVGALERERAASHLGWLSSLGRLLGYSWLEARAGKLQIALLRAADAEEVGGLEAEVGKLVRRVLRTPLLARRLKGIGTLPEASETSGPLARAAGLAKDARSGGIYRAIGFEPVVREGDDVLARLRTRLAEIEQSLKLVRKAGAVSFPEGTLASPLGSIGSATVETPRGAATLRMKLQSDVVDAVELETPSSLHLRLIGAVAEEREVADALLGVASLDLSPWEVAR